MPLPLYTGAACIIACSMLLLFLVAQYLENNSIVDIFWGLGFCLVTAWLLYREYSNALEGQPLFPLFLFSALIFAWGLRLAFYIFRRNRGHGEDWRYRNFRKRWGSYPRIGAFLQVFLLQGIFMFIIALPIIHTFYHGIYAFTLLHAPGFILWGIGFYFEAAGDAQLYRFKQDPTNTGKPMTTGLWRYTRHPNYFGEILMWWGIWILSVNIFDPIFTLVSLLSPLTITWLLTRVSGVPLTESRYKDNPAYQDYIRSTPALFPRFF